MGWEGRARGQSLRMQSKWRSELMWLLGTPALPPLALGSRFRSENAREHTAQFPSPTGFATTCPAPAISQTVKGAQAPGVRAGSSLGPQCSGRHSFRSLDSFSLGIAVHHGCRFEAATIVHPPQALTAVLRAPLCCIASLLSSPRVRSGPMWCLHQSEPHGAGPRPPLITARLLLATVREPRLETFCT